MNPGRFGIPAALYLAMTIGPLFLFASAAAARITVVGHWRMGEDDSPRPPGSTIPDRTKDRRVPPNDLTLKGSPERSKDTPNPKLSTVSMKFNPATGDVCARNFVPTTNLNVGMECWAKADSKDGEAFVVYNGDGADCGFGFMRVHAKWTVFFGSFQRWPVADVELGTWIHLAVAIDDKGATAYVNGVQSTVIPHVPNPPTKGVLMVGGQPDGNGLFKGNIDEVSLFTFNPGEFQPADLGAKPSSTGLAPTPVAAAPTPPPNPLAVTPAPNITWITDPPAAAARARASNKNIFIFVYSDKTKDCRRTLNETFSQQVVKNLLTERFVCLKVDVRKNTDLMTYFSIFRAGTVLAVTPQGRVLARLDQSYVSTPQLVKLLSGL